MAKLEQSYNAVLFSSLIIPRSIKEQLYMQINESVEVNVFDFNDYREYLQKIFEYRQNNNPNYSLRQFGKDMGFSSPGHLNTILEKKVQLGRIGVSKISKALGLKGNKEEYLRTLVKLNHAKDMDDEVKYQTILQKIRPEAKRTILDGPLNYYISNRMCVIITLLIVIYGKDFSPDPLWIIKRVRVTTTIDEILKALTFLIKESFIERQKGVYVVRKVNFSSKDEIRSKFVQQFHNELLSEAAYALRYPLEEREFRNLTVTIQKNRIKELKEKIKEFYNNVKNWINEGENKDEHHLKTIVSINLQMYPLSDLPKTQDIPSHGLKDEK